MRKNKQGGFTLIEMLIVVAIIAILIAISIPLVSSALENARVATDEANERSAKAAALLAYMTYDPNEHTATSPGTDEEMDVYNALTGTTGAAYNAVTGKLEDAGSDVTQGYGKCLKEHKQVGGTETAGPHGDANNKIIFVKIPTTGDQSGEVVGGWAAKDKTIADVEQGHLLTIPG